MTHQTPEEEAKWNAAMIKLEEERGDIVPGGAQGGVIAKARRTREGESAPRKSAAQRARRRVRFIAQAVEPPFDVAA